VMIMVGHQFSLMFFSIPNNFIYILVNSIVTTIYREKDLNPYSSHKREHAMSLSCKDYDSITIYFYFYFGWLLLSSS
jgi:hypothetical protein